jgi:hypothetical protein
MKKKLAGWQSRNSICIGSDVFIVFLWFLSALKFNGKPPRGGGQRYISIEPSKTPLRPLASDPTPFELIDLSGMEISGRQFSSSMQGCKPLDRLRSRER